MTAINDIGTQQAEPTKNTQVKIERLLYYAATYPHVKLSFHASDMILQVESDATYPVLPKARSLIAGYFRLSKQLKNTRQQHPNGAVLIEYKTLKNVVSSAAEGERCGIFHNVHPTNN